MVVMRTTSGRAGPIDRASFTALVRRYDDRLRGVAYRLLGGDTQRLDDVLQDAYLRAYSAFGGFRGDAAEATWLYRIVTNACLDELRRRARRPTPVDPVGWDEPELVAGPDEAAVTADVVIRALASLPPEQRATVVLVDGEGFDHTGAADVLGVAVGTVASRLSRARETMRRTIREDDR
jgi:RNA polymerase sigma-70 factor (ECF subfamily)